MQGNKAVYSVGLKLMRPQPADWLFILRYSIFQYDAATRTRWIVLTHFASNYINACTVLAESTTSPRNASEFSYTT